MAQIDVGRTAFAGFGLIARRPMAVLGWAAFLFVLGVLPVFGLMAAMGSSIAELIRLGEAGGDPTPEQMMPLMSTWYAANPILWIVSLITRVMLMGAVFRAVLEPAESRWAYLRLGMGEVMLALVVIVLGVILGIGAMIWILVTFGVGFAVWQASHGAAIGIGVLSGLALAVVMIWLSLRFSLAAPMSLAERNFRLFESWSLTRGNTLNLLLVALILVVVLIALEAVIVAVGLTALSIIFAGGFGPWDFDEAAVEAFFRQPPSVLLATVAPWILGLGIVFSLVGAALLAIVTAPWAEVYRQLRKSPEPAL